MAKGKHQPGEATPNSAYLDDRGATFDPGVNDSTRDIYTNPENLPEGLRQKREGPLGPTQSRRGGNEG